MDITLVLIMLVINTVVTTIAVRHYYRGRFVGQLRIDRSDPDDGPYLFAEIMKGVGDISKMKYVTFIVCNKNYISRE